MIQNVNAVWPQMRLVVNNFGSAMIDKSKQLVIRVEFYIYYLFNLAVVISVFEVPFFFWRPDVARYVFPIGWLVLFALGIRRMWLVKIENGLTSELQVYKVVVCIIAIIFWCLMGYHFVAHYDLTKARSVAQANWAANVEYAKFVVPFVVNSFMTGAVAFGGVITVWLVDNMRVALGR